MSNATNGGQFPNYSNGPHQVPQMPYQQPQPPKPPKKNRKGLKIVGGIAGGFVALIVIAGIAGGGGSANDAAHNGAAQPSVTQSPKPAVTKPTRQAHTPAPKPTPTETEGTGCDPINSTPDEYEACIDKFLNEGETPKPTKAKPKMTASQEQAVGAAEDYLKYSAFSRKGLIKQLTSEYGAGFSTKDATFAVDYLKVNWNEQAAKAAKAYLEYSHFSRAGLIKQLTSDYGSGFTKAQAEYGVKKAGL